MFSVFFTLLILALPIPPIPTAAMFNLSDGALCPNAAPITLPGTTVIAAKPAPEVFKKSALEIFFDIVVNFKVNKCLSIRV